MPKPAPSAARQALSDLRQNLKAAEQCVDTARAPIARLEAEITAGEVAQARLAVIRCRHAQRMAEWSETGRGAAPDPASDEDTATLAAATARADAARAALYPARQRVDAAEHDLAVQATGLKPAIAQILREAGAALAAEYWRRAADIERLRRDLAALDQLLAADFPIVHAPTGRSILRFVSPEKQSAPDTMRAFAAACADIPATARFLAAWREKAAELAG